MEDRERFLRLPDPNRLFGLRAARFRVLADRQSNLAGYLRLMADVAELQQHLVQAPTDPAVSTDRSTWLQDAGWRQSLRRIADEIHPNEAPARQILERLRVMADDELDRIAGYIVNADIAHLDPGITPFVAAALQSAWTLNAARLDAAGLVIGERADHCPACGSLPVAGVLQTGGDVQGLRHLCCALCATEWHRPRIQCVHCGSSRAVGYYGIEGEGEAIKAEACDDCRSYLKLMNRDKDAGLDPFADDIASLGLDLLMAEAGYHRLGFNPFLIPGG